jgi:hypothetical protein
LNISHFGAKFVLDQSIMGEVFALCVGSQAAPRGIARPVLLLLLYLDEWNDPWQ